MDMVKDKTNRCRWKWLKNETGDNADEKLKDSTLAQHRLSIAQIKDSRSKTLRSYSHYIRNSDRLDTKQKWKQQLQKKYYDIVVNIALNQLAALEIKNTNKNKTKASTHTSGNLKQNWTEVTLADMYKWRYEDTIETSIFNRSFSRFSYYYVIIHWHSPNSYV